jgi:anti-sigma regulatory factor (Ser/Thr protein kinase)
MVVADARSGGAAALDWLEDRCRAAGLGGNVVLEVRVVAEEVLTNIAKYAFGPGTSAAVELLVSLGDEAAVLEFRDEGRPFDPLAQPAPDLDGPPEDRPLGGLGLALVRGLVEEARYERVGGTNVLRLVKRRGAL